MPSVPYHNHDMRYYRRAEVNARLQGAQLLATLLTVDGAGSGLDADTLDGSQASAFAAASHTHDDRYFTETESDARFGRLAAANTWTANQYFSPTLAAGTYSVQVTGVAGAARDIFLAGQAGYSNGFTVKYTGSAMQYAFVDGNVGIGRTDPQAKLDVNNGNIYISHATPGTVSVPTGGYLTWNSAAYGGVSARIRSTDSLYESFASALTFETRNWDGGFALVERMRLDRTGLGVGTTSPQRKLHVVGTILIDGDEGGYAGTVGLTDVTAGAGGYANGTVKMAGVTGRNSVGWLKIYVGTTAYYIPYWDNYS